MNSLDWRRKRKAQIRAWAMATIGGVLAGLLAYRVFDTGVPIAACALLAFGLTFEVCKGTQ